MSDFGQGAQRVGDQYSPAEKERALNDWTGGDYTNINGVLYGAPKNSRLVADPWDQLHKIDEALADHPTTDTFTVDRMTLLKTFEVTTVQDALKIKPGKSFDHPGFQATSLNEGGAAADGKPRIATRILVSPGTPAAYLEHITVIRGEEEILLPRSSRSSKVL